VFAVLEEVVVEVAVEVRDGLVGTGSDLAFVQFLEACRHPEPRRAHLGMVVESIVMEEG